jgi:hypothetical protein
MTAGAVQGISRDERGRFVRGISGNSAGHVRSRQHREMLEAYAAEFGGLEGMTPAERMDLDEAVSSLVRSKRANHTDAVRLKNDARKWLEGIRVRRGIKSEPQRPAVPSIAEIMGLNRP